MDERKTKYFIALTKANRERQWQRQRKDIDTQ